MAREFRHFLADIGQAINTIQMATAGKSFADYQGDILLRLALKRAVEIISEASRHIPEDIKSLRPEIPWTKIRGIGNVLRHEYNNLSDQIIWGVIQDEIPKLGVAITALQHKFDKS